MNTNEVYSPIKVSPSKYLITIIAVIASGAVGIAIGGFKQRTEDQKVLTVTSSDRAIPTVMTIAVNVQRDNDKLVLPGTLQAYNSAPIYARVSGYLKNWKVDIGNEVKTGQILAEIDSPDLDQQLKESIANLNTAKAIEKLAETTARRWQNLLRTDSVSVQEVDEKNGDYSAKKTMVAAAQANVERLRALESFKRIVAPFDGIITSRNTDIGALINAGQQTGRELFTIADTHKLRLYVTLPQNYATRIKPDMAVQVDVPEHPGQHFSAKFISTSQSINEASGTILIQFEVDNKNHTLLPGDFGSVLFTFPPNEKSIQIPPSAIVVKKEGLFVVVVDKNNHVNFRKIEVLRDLGTSIEVVTGLTSTEALIDNPPDFLVNGDQVKLQTSSTSSAKPVSAPATEVNLKSRP